MKATKAQVAALRWLIAKGWTEQISSNTLMVWYEERALAEHEADVRRDYGFRPTTNRLHAWRRTSGRVLGQMQRAGLLDEDGWNRYTPRFKINAAGYAAVESEAAVPVRVTAETAAASPSTDRASKNLTTARRGV